MVKFLHRAVSSQIGEKHLKANKKNNSRNIKVTQNIRI